jgi:hypothetical protein
MWSGFSVETEAFFKGPFYYRVIPTLDVSPSRRRIASEAADRALARLALACQRPSLSWYREGGSKNYDFISDRSIAGQTRLKWTQQAINVYLSAELHTVEHLVRTVAHEIKHAYQLTHFRPPLTAAEYEAAELDANRFEGLVWNDWVRDHGDTVGDEANMLALKWWAGEQG